jgi:hypothetical protein
MIVLSEALDQPCGNCDRTLRVSTEIAKILGFPVYVLADVAASTEPFAQIPVQQPTTAGIWLGSPPACDRYRAVYDAILARGIQLLNTPEQYEQVQRCDWNNQPINEQILAASIANSENGRSLKDYAPDFAYPPHKGDFPRIFRVFLYGQTILTYSYRWDIDSPLKWLTVEDEEAVFAAALVVAESMAAPFVAIDVGQQENGTWIGLSAHDAQFATLGHTPLVQLWYELEKIFQISLQR